MAILFFLFFILPVGGLLVMTAITYRHTIFGKVLGYICIALVVLAAVLAVIFRLSEKKILKRKDYYGTYVIDRDVYAGKQADWQYEHIRFEIRDKDSVFFM